MIRRIDNERTATFTARSSGSSGYEVLADGEVVAWTVDGYWAAAITAMLNENEARPGPATCLPRPADDGHPRLPP
jgi:hypothetical protein